MTRLIILIDNINLNTKMKVRHILSFTTNTTNINISIDCLDI